MRLSFGEVEARLARLHEIATEKRTQFQARLRNFQKHGVPHFATADRGKAIRYHPGQVVELAIAIEITQLGLSPERTEVLFRKNIFPIMMAVRMAARSILTKGGFLPDADRGDVNDGDDDPLSMFLYFDPFALEALTDIEAKYAVDPAEVTFFYGGEGVIRENIVRWTAGPHMRRLALINVTALLWGLVVRLKLENQRRFLEETLDWFDGLEEMQFLEVVDSYFEDYGDDADVVKIETHADVLKYADKLRSLRGLPVQVADAMINLAKLAIGEGRAPGPDGKPTGKPLPRRSKEISDGDR